MAALRSVSLHLFTPGTYKAYKFSASETVAEVHQEANNTKSIFVDHKQTLVLGEVRYLHNEDHVDNYITDEFYAAVMVLPVTLLFIQLTAADKQVYQDFINEWGTVSESNEGNELNESNELFQSVLPVILSYRIL